jgi:hypothetical protein
VIVGSLLLIVVAIALLAMGLLDGSNAYLVSSIAASLLAAIALVVGSRQARAARVYAGEEPSPGPSGSYPEETLVTAERDGYRHGENEPMTEVIPPFGARGDERAVRDDERAVREDERAVREDERAVREQKQGNPPPVAVRSMIPTQGGAPDLSRDRAGRLTLDGDPDDPGDADELPDEPVAQQVSAGDADRVARMSNDVLVIDGRPRYHLAGCVHLLGRESEPLPVQEAVELGFTPCGLCEPDSVLLAEGRRV